MKRLLLGLLAAVLALLAATAVGLGVIHITDFPYTADIGALDIEAGSGLDREEIMANYGAVMDFLSPFSREEFDLPSLGYTEMGAGHFEDCRVFFGWVYLLGAGALAVFALLTIIKVFDKRVLRYGGIMTVAIPMVFCVGAAIDFDIMFVFFHKIFFEGQTWIFDPSKDEIINILPESFFMHCAIFIAAFWVLAAGLQLFFSDLRRRKPAEHIRKPVYNK